MGIVNHLTKGWSERGKDLSLILTFGGIIYRFYSV
jgi:hypothetical protein